MQDSTKIMRQRKKIEMGNILKLLSILEYTELDTVHNFGNPLQQFNAANFTLRLCRCVHFLRTQWHSFYILQSQQV